MKKIYYVMFSMLLMAFVACDNSIENEHQIDTPQEISITGNWEVNAYLNNELVYGPFTVSTRMASDSEIYIKDNGEFWNFQSKANLLDSNSEFDADLALNEISNFKANVKIQNGVIDNQDIAFDILFEDDETPYGFTYQIRGVRK